MKFYCQHLFVRPWWGLAFLALTAERLRVVRFSRRSGAGQMKSPRPPPVPIEASSYLSLDRCTELPMPIRPRNPKITHQRDNASAKSPTNDVPAPTRIRKSPESPTEAELPLPQDAKRTGPNWNEDGTYKIGNCKPPPGRRFQPGQSGNPKGRPKGKPSMDTLAIDLMEQKITLTSPQGGQDQDDPGDDARRAKVGVKVSPGASGQARTPKPRANGAASAEQTAHA